MVYYLHKTVSQLQTFNSSALKWSSLQNARVNLIWFLSKVTAINLPPFWKPVRLIIFSNLCFCCKMVYLTQKRKKWPYSKFFQTNSFLKTEPRHSAQYAELRYSRITFATLSMTLFTCTEYCYAECRGARGNNKILLIILGFRHCQTDKFLELKIWRIISETFWALRHSA